jgi:hypothetical protein
MRNRHVTDVRPALETLEPRECFSAATPYSMGFVGGVRVAVGDVNNDAATAGVNVAIGDGSVRFTVDGISPAASFKGGIYVAGGVFTDNRD